MCAISYSFLFVKTWVSHDWLWRNEELLWVYEGLQKPTKTLEWFHWMEQGQDFMHK